MKTYYGFYRAKVTDNKDPEKYGRVKVWIPDLMPTIDEDDPKFHLWARPANNPIGGRNNIESKDQFFIGTSYIPKKGSWVWCFFENGNPNRPYYWGALDIENSPVLAENQYGENYEHKWTIFKSSEGRCIVISDDPDDMRTEITGKKRKIQNPPSGDVTSVYNILNNQTTILLDERFEKEKILIKTYKGDYLNFDIETRKLYIYTADDIHIKSDNSIYIEAKNNIHMKSGLNTFISAGGEIHENASSNVNIDGANTYIQSGTSIPALNSDPIGIRNQNITECSIIVDSVAVAIHQLKLAEKLIDSLDDVSAIGDESLKTMDKIGAYIDDTIAEVGSLDPTSTKANIDSSVQQVDDLVNGPLNDSVSHVSTLSNNYSDLKQKLSDTKLHCDKLDSIFNARNPNTKDAYNKLQNTKKLLLSMESSINTDQAKLGSVEGLFDIIHSSNANVDMTSVKNSVDSLAGAAPSLNTKKQNLDDLKTSFKSKKEDFILSKADSLNSIANFSLSVGSVDPLKSVTSGTIVKMAANLMPTSVATIDRSILQNKMLSGFANISSSQNSLISSVKTSLSSLDTGGMLSSMSSLMSGLSNISSMKQNITFGLNPLFEIKNSISSAGMMMKNFNVGNSISILNELNNIQSGLSDLVRSSAEQLPEEKRDIAISSADSAEDLCNQMFTVKDDLETNSNNVNDAGNVVSTAADDPLDIPDPTGSSPDKYDDLSSSVITLTEKNTAAEEQVEDTTSKLESEQKKYTQFTESQKYVETVPPMPTIPGTSTPTPEVENRQEILDVAEHKALNDKLVQAQKEEEEAKRKQDDLATELRYMQNHKNDYTEEEIEKKSDEVMAAFDEHNHAIRSYNNVLLTKGRG